jgi:nicotinate-nucleotide adenylyltransferase
VTPRTLKTAILGGTFDPIHLGHLQIACRALETFPLDRVFIIPCAAPPHKTDGQLADGRHRLAMARAAVKGDRRFRVLDMEVRRGGISYSIDTLNELRGRYPHDQFFFIMGSDNFEHVGTWHRFREVVRQCEFLVIARPGFPLRMPPPSIPAGSLPDLRYHVIESTPMDVSSTRIRRRLSNRESVERLVPAAVLGYIRRHHLYEP